MYEVLANTTTPGAVVEAAKTLVDPKASPTSKAVAIVQIVGPAKVIGVLARGAAKAFKAARALTKTERIAEHLTQRDLSAAAREVAGEVVAVKPSGVPFNHIMEVREAQQGLLNRIDAINQSLARSGLSSAERAGLESELSRASRLLDYSERYLPR